MKLWVTHWEVVSGPIISCKIANQRSSKGDSASVSVGLIRVCGSGKADLQNTLSLVSASEVPTGPSSTWQKKLLSSITLTGEMTRVMSVSMVTRSVNGVSLSMPVSVDDLKATRFRVPADSYEKETDSKTQIRPEHKCLLVWENPAGNSSL